MTKYLLPLLMVIPILVQGQDIFNISFGDNRTGEILQVFDSDIYRFEGQAGDRIWIRATDAASSIDASLKLSKGATLYQIVEGNGGDVDIFDFVLPESGIFDIEIYDRGRNDSGAYGLSLQRLNNPDYGKQIHCGDDIFDEISTHVGVKVYQFAVEPGDKAFAQLRAVSAHFEATLYLFNENGDLLAKSIRKANPFAMIRDINVLTAEKYSLFAFDANGNDQSEFGLTYQDLNDPTCGTKPVACAYHSEAKISILAETHAYDIQLEEGQGFVAKAMAPNHSFETVVDVYNPLGEMLFHRRVSGKACDIVIPRVHMSGSYLMLINDDRANDTSHYYLTYNLLDVACAQELPTCRTMESALDVKADINLYYFMMPEQMNGLTIKEIDRVIEPFGIIINANDYTILKDNVKLHFESPMANPGSIIYLALSDNAGNDTGGYKIDFIKDEGEEPGLSAPVALCREGLSFTLPPSGHLEITSADIDAGSYDDCQIVEMKVTPDNFDCLTVGEQEITLEVIDNDGLISSCTTTIDIRFDLELVLDECQKIVVDAAFDLEACREIIATATGGSGDYNFVWSNGETSPLATICPGDVSNLRCEIFDNNGCSVAKDLWMPLGVNVLCHSNGKKVSICHVPTGNPEERQTLCVSITSLKSHVGHEDYLGPCDGGGGCGEESEVSLKTHVNGHLTISGLVAQQGDLVRVNLKDEFLVRNTKIDLTLVDALGRNFYHETALASSIEFLELQLPSSGLAPGMYYLLLRSLDGSSRQITAPILIK